jgi:hypothetical protein
MKVRWILSLIVLLSLAACKKSTIQVQELPETNDPVFRISGTVDNETVLYEAGVNGAKVENGTLFKNNVPFAFGQMVTADGKYRLGVFDGNGELPPLASFLTGGDSLLLADRFIEPLMVLSRANHSNADKITSIKWFIDGKFVGYDEYTISQPGKYVICGEYQFYNGHTEVVCNTLTVGFDNDMDVKIEHYMSGSYNVSLYLSGEDTLNISDVKWYNEDTLLGTGFNVWTSVGNYTKVRAEITSVKNNKYTREIIVNGSNLGCYTEDFINFVKPTSKTWDYAVGLEIERNGEIFSTLNSQNFKSKLFVEDFELYEVRSNGDVVYKLKGVIDAKLSNANQSSSFFIHLNYVYPLILKN